MLISSLPFHYWAYKGYQRPLEELVQSVLYKHQSIGNSSARAQEKIAIHSGTEEHVRRAVASAVASRALRVATSASVGAFGLVSALGFYWMGCQTMGEAIQITERWAQERRIALDAWLSGISNNNQRRVDRTHPEYLAVQNMTEEEELEYISKKYLPDEEWDRPEPEPVNQE